MAAPFKSSGGGGGRAPLERGFDAQPHFLQMESSKVERRGIPIIRTQSRVFKEQAEHLRAAAVSDSVPNLGWDKSPGKDARRPACPPTSNAPS